MPRKRKTKKLKKIEVRLDEPDVCIICLAETDDKLIKSSNSVFLIDGDYCSKQSCTCSVMVHQLCMESWITYKYACPICLRHMQKTLIPTTFFQRASSIAYYVFIAIVFIKGIHQIISFFATFFVVSKDDFLTI